MPSPATNDDFLDLARKSRQIDMSRLEAYLDERRSSDTLPPDPKKLAALLVQQGLLTGFQAEQLLQGRYKGFQLGGYRLLERLGSGGTGTVFLAEHEVMKRQVALKVLPPSFARDEGVLERFRREAQAVAALHHPNIVHAYDFRKEGDLHFLVLEYVPGSSLAEVIERQGPLPPAVACDYLRQAALGLDHAHQAGLVHRDVKPANLLVGPDGLVKVLDLGLARFTPEGEQSLTRQFDEHTVMGTADYIAPEQALNLHEVDGRADIYSLGATLYTLIAGEPPFNAGTMTQKLLWHQMRDPAPLTTRQPACPLGVAEVVARMMAKSPEERYQTAAEVAEALAPYAAEVPTPQGPPRPGGAGARPTSPYVKRTGLPPRSATRSDGVPAPAKPRSTARRDGASPPAGRAEDRGGESVPRPRIATDVRLRPAKGTVAAVEGVGIALLTALVGGVMLVVGGVVAFVIWAPAPRATEVVKVGGNILEAPVRTVPPPFRLPDGNGEVFALRGHTGAVTGVMFAPTRSQVASAGADGTVRVWDLALRQGAHTITAPGGARSVELAADGRRALISQGGGALLYDLEQQKAIRSFAGEGGATCQAIFNSTQDLVLMAAADGVVRVFQAATGQRTKVLQGHAGAVRALTARPQQPQQVLSGGDDGTVRLWDLANQRLIRQYGHPAPKPPAQAKGEPVTLAAHARPCLSVGISADGRLAVSGGADGVVYVWEVETGRQVLRFADHQKPVRAVALSPDGQMAASGGDDQQLRVWWVGMARPARAFPGHAGPITGLAFSPDGRHVVTGGQDSTVRVWAVR